MIRSLFILLILVFFIGCTDWRGRDDLPTYKGIAPIPDKCAEFEDDLCGLFDCMVDLCWCNDIGPAGAILKVGDTAIKTEEEATTIINTYLAETKLDYTVERSHKLNPVFFNVFTVDEANDEHVYTVAVDGTIMLTQCGV